MLPSGKTATPFSTVAVDESRVGATETLRIVLSPQNIYNPLADFGIITDALGGGSLNGPGLLPPGASAKANYAVAAISPAMLTTLHNLAFVGPPGTAPDTSTIALTVNDGSQTAADFKTTVLA